MMQPVCLNCRVAMRIHETGAFLEQMTEQGTYRIWCADFYQCPGCGVNVASGFGKQAFAEKHQMDYRDIRKQYRPRRFWATAQEQQAYRMRHAPGELVKLT